MSGLQHMDDMIQAMCYELETRQSFLSLGSKSKIETIYFGGGTPSLLSPRQIGSLLNKTTSIFDTTLLKEITIEANPDDLSPEYLSALRQEGVNRLSIGIQSLIDSHLTWMNRRHNASQAIKAVENAQQAGFDNISVDLIYGLPIMTLKELRENLTRILSLRVQHISAYHLTIEENSILGKRTKKGEFTPVSDDISQCHYDMVHSILSESGFCHYEISNFALPGYKSVHNSNYWNGTEYLGIGPSAHSFNGSQRQWNVKSNSIYLRNIRNGSYFETEVLSENDHYNEYVMTSLRTDSGIDTDILSKRFGARKLQYFVAQAEKFVAQGNIVQRKSVYYIPAERYLISDSIISDLFDVE